MNRTLLALAAALTLGGIALFYVYMARFLALQTGGLRVAVVVAATDVPFGAPLQEAWLTVEDVPQSYLEDRHLPASELRSLIGVPLAQAVRAGEAILRSDLTPLSDQQRTLSATIPRGRRALSLVVLPESSFAGMLRPGDRVDVLWTTGGPRDGSAPRAIVVAQNVLVLSVGLALAQGGDDERLRLAARAAQVSVEVGLDDAQRLSLARERGRLRLLLRNPADVAVNERAPEVRIEQLLDPVRRGGWTRRFAIAE